MSTALISCHMKSQTWYARCIAQFRYVWYPMVFFGMFRRIPGSFGRAIAPSLTLHCISLAWFWAMKHHAQTVARKPQWHFGARFKRNFDALGIKARAILNEFVLRGILKWWYKDLSRNLSELLNLSDGSSSHNSFPLKSENAARL